MKHIFIECTDMAHMRETFYSANDMKELFQNIQNDKKCYIIPKSDNYIRQNLREISTRPNFSDKLFLYKKYYNKIWFFSQAVPKKKKKNIFCNNRILYK